MILQIIMNINLNNYIISDNLKIAEENDAFQITFFRDHSHSIYTPKYQTLDPTANIVLSWTPPLCVHFSSVDLIYYAEVYAIPLIIAFC